MKRKRFKKTMVAAITCTALIASLTACGGNNSSPSNQGNTNSEGTNSEYTNNELSLSGTPSTLFNNGERQIWYSVPEKHMGKDGNPAVYVFENGKVTVFKRSGHELTFGDFEGKNDDEIIAMLEDSGTKQYGPCSFTLHIETDETGNSTIEETLEIIREDGETISEYFDRTTTMAYTVYSKEYAGFIGGSSSWVFITRVDGAFDLSLDQPGADGVEVD